MRENSDTEIINWTATIILLKVLEHATARLNLLKKDKMIRFRNETA